MKTKLIKIVLLTMMIVLINHQSVFTRERTDNDTSKIRIGLGIDLFTLNDFYSFSPPHPHLMVLFDINRTFSIEPEIGFYSTKEYDNYYNSETDRSGVALGIGLYLKKEIKRINFYSGIKLSYGSSKSFTDRDSREFNRKQFDFGPVFGVEYLLNKQFSIGCDFIVNYHNHKTCYTDDDTEDSVDWNKGFSIRKSMKLRYYF